MNEQNTGSPTTESSFEWTSASSLPKSRGRMMRKFVIGFVIEPCVLLAIGWVWVYAAKLLAQWADEPISVALVLILGGLYFLEKSERIVGWLMARWTP